MISGHTPRRKDDWLQRALIQILKNSGIAAAPVSGTRRGRFVDVSLLGPRRIKCKTCTNELYRKLGLGNADVLIVGDGRGPVLAIARLRLVVAAAKAAALAKAAQNSRTAGISAGPIPAERGDVEMRNDKQEPKTENLPVRTDDGFGDESDDDRLLQGTRLICIDGEWTFAKDETKVPADKQFFVLGTAEGQQHWEDGKLVEEHKKKSGVPLAKTVDELNDKIPKETWEEGINGPRPPWTYIWAVYLLDETDGAVYTHLNHTDGAKIATRELQSRVRWKRAMLGGRKVKPIVTLGRRLVSRQFKKIGPDFIIVDWRDLEPGLPQQAAPRQLEDHTEKAHELNDPVDDIGRPMGEPSMEKILDDKIPEDKWQQEAAAKAAVDAPATPPQKPAAQKPQMTKKGVQKIAGSRR
jgi:hypothetical protein